MTEPTTKYRVLSSILMGGKTYAIGASIALTAEQAEALRPTGAIDVSGAGIGETAARLHDVLSGDTAQAGDDDAKVADAIRAVVATLDPKDKSHFTRDGKPQIAVVEKALGFQVTRAEIDAALQAG